MKRKFDLNCDSISLHFTNKATMMLYLFLGLLTLVNSQASTSSGRRSCPIGFYGADCKTRCNANCISYQCDDVTGNCTKGCKDGWTGGMCQDVCDQGYFGANCSMECSRNCLADLCDPVLGVCEKGCNAGWLGRRCSNVCRQGFYGEKCKTKCSNNCSTKECHHVSGYCLKGCKKGFWGSDCSLFGDIQDIPEPMRGRFYSKLSPESRSVLLYLLMGEYERTLETAQMDINRGIKQRNELKNLIG